MTKWKQIRNKVSITTLLPIGISTIGVPNLIFVSSKRSKRASQTNWYDNTLYVFALFRSTEAWFSLQTKYKHLKRFPYVSFLVYEALLMSVHNIRHNITKTCLYNFDPLKPHLYIVKVEFTRVYIIFFISAQKHRLWVLIRTASSRRF